MVRDHAALANIPAMLKAKEGCDGAALAQSHCVMAELTSEGKLWFAVLTLDWFVDAQYERIKG